MAVGGKQAAPKERWDAKELEGVGGDLRTLEAFGSFARGVEDVYLADADNVLEGVRLAAKFDEFGSVVAAAAAGLAALHAVDLDADDAVGGAVGERLEEDILDHAEDGGGGTDAETKGDDGHDNEARVLAEAAKAVVHILTHAGHAGARRD
jgi:hypothetical protein